MTNKPLLCVGVLSVVLAALGLGILVRMATDGATEGQPDPMLKKGDEYSIFRMAFSPDGTLVATANSNDRVSLWERATGKKRADIAAHKGPVYAVAFSSEGKLLASGGCDDTIRLFELKTLQNVRTWVGHEDTVTFLAFASDDRALVSGCVHFIKVWDLATGRERVSVKGPHW